MDLTGNYLHGEIPSQLANLYYLRHLDLSSYGIWLTSSNLQWLSNLSSLEYLSLSHVDVGDKNWGSIIGSLVHLKHLDLSWCHLPAPTIPTALLNISSLTFLGLSGNSVSNLPSWMGKLSSLTHLKLCHCNISGSILDTIRNLSGLEYLDLAFNDLTGQIHVSLGQNLRQYGSLSHLNLWGNHLEGTIPSSLGFLINLTYLDLSENRLLGNIPSSLGNLRELETLHLASTPLNGSLPLLFAQLSSLQTLWLSDNNMNGTITEFFFEKSFKLETLYLSHSGLSLNISSTWIPSFQLGDLESKQCQIEGPIPSWISTQYSLYWLDLSSNQLMGNLPSWLWDMESLLYIDLSDNHLQGSFTPTSGSLRYLDLSKNELSGHLPADIHVQLSNAEVLILAGNKFEGQIPTSITNLRDLYSLDISNNSLIGTVPATLGNLSELRVLHLENNSLDGEIPKELGSLSNLQSLRIGKNSLQGFLPSSFKNLSSLQVLDVGENNLTGSIPHWIANFSDLQVLVLRSNSFRGRLPSDIGRMPKLQVLDLSSNFFSGRIPHSYLRFPFMQNSSADREHLSISTPSLSYSENIDIIVKGQELHYEYVLRQLVCIDLSNNRLSGPLPPEIENLKGLLFLNLSRNSLSGPIPEGLGKLVQLESLDLSSNKFSGQIPWEFGNLDFLGYLNFSHNNLSGRIPREGHMLTLTLDESAYKGNPNLWGCPLQSNCSPPIAGAFPLPGVEGKREKGFEFPWYWMCFGLSVGVGFSAVVMVLLFKHSWRTKCFEIMDRVIEGMDSVICMLAKRKPWWG